MDAHTILSQIQTIQAALDELRLCVAIEEEKQPQKTPLQTIAEETSQAFGYTITELRSRCRKPRYIAARATFAHVANRLGYSVTQIGRFLNRDHSTVIFLLQKNAFENRLENYPEFRADMETVLKFFKIENDEN